MSTYRSQRRYSTDSDSSSSSSSGYSYDDRSVRSGGSRNSSRQSARSQNTVRTEVWRCRECDREFATRQGLNCHITTVHERPRTATTSREPDLDLGRLAIRGSSDRFPCQHCDRDYATQGNLNRHIREHHGQAGSGAGAGTSISVRRRTNIQNNVNIQNNYFFYRK